MKIIKNNIIPTFGAYAMAWYPRIFVRNSWLKRMEAYRIEYNEKPGNGAGDRYAKSWYDRVIGHEKIHFEQQKELGLFKFVFVYLWYVVRFGYNDNPMELEAYENQEKENYIKERSSFAYKNYVKWKKKK